MKPTRKTRKTEKEIATVYVAVSGGMVQAVYADVPVNVEVVDYDNIKAGDDPTPSYTMEEEIAAGNLILVY